VNCLREGDRFNAASFVERIISKFDLLWDGQFAKSQKKVFAIHMDNCPVHRSMNIQVAPHPPYSLDWVSSDFFVFGYRRKELIGLELKSPEDLFGMESSHL
jgi:hypothetical protein